jgi:hypothetical protein
MVSKQEHQKGKKKFAPGLPREMLVRKMVCEQEHQKE